MSVLNTRNVPLIVRRLATRLKIVVAGIFACVATGRAQVPYGAGELQLALEKLTVLGSVLYISAHPDDENTAFLATMAKGKLYRTGYLSLTRGEGGQNLLGSEQGDALSLIRTQELLAARRIDGAEQFFSRAIDFGYSKSADETLEVWGKDETLADVVWVIRSFRPDVIVTRFTPGRGGHGNHTASAILAFEAFRAAADPTRFPEQLQMVEPWQAKRIVWNVFRFSRSRGDQPSGSHVTMDLGQYNPLLGLSYGELSGMSRSMHKSQGFGAMEQRGTWTNAFEHVEGDTARTDLFDGVETSWKRVRGAEMVGALLERAAREFTPARPSAILPILCDALSALEDLPSDPWISVKQRDLKNAILACSGIWLEALGSEYMATAGSTLEVTARLVNRSSEHVRLERVGITTSPQDTLLGQTAHPNTPLEVSLRVTIPEHHRPTQPYWLDEQRELGRYQVSDRSMIGSAENPPELVVRFWLGLGGRSVSFDVPVRYRWVDPTLGEQSRPLMVVPPVSLAMRDAVLFSIKGEEVVGIVLVRPTVASVSGVVRLDLPQGWTSEPTAHRVDTDSSLSERSVTFRLLPGPGARGGIVTAVMEIGGQRHVSGFSSIAYPHIEPQDFLVPAESRLLLLDLERPSMRIGYIMGSGDGIPNLLHRIGYRVDLLTDDAIEAGNLGAYDAIVAGVRAYNTRPVLRASHDRLLHYVEEGGRYIVQYVTRQQLGGSAIGPYPFAISNARVSVETAPIVRPNPDHSLLRKPNRITDADFDGWVQERGLYFADSWDPRYETVLISHDPGEDAQAGGLLYARYGKGYFLYTGYSWFRQLPAGVPGAYRLFVNLLSQDVERGK